MNPTSMSAAGASSTGLPGRPIVTVPIEVSLHQIRLPVSIQDSQPFHLILDTGMPTRGVLLNESPRVDSLGLAYHGNRTIRGAGGSGAGLAARTATASSVTLNGHAIPQVPVIVLPGNAGLPDDVDGVIGAELFEKYIVCVDADRRQVELFDPATWTLPAGSASVPLRLRDRKVFVDARVAVDADSALGAELAVDLGAGHSLWLRQREARFAPPARTLTTTLGYGLSGELMGQVGRVRRFEIGPFAFDDVVAIFTRHEPQNRVDAAFSDGFIGAEILTRFRVTFDYARERMVLEPGARFREPFHYDMSGLALDPRARERATVVAVLPGTPSDEAGIRPGDALLSIDRRALAAMSPDDMNRALNVDGAEVVLGIERDSTYLEKRIVLRPLL